MPSRTLRRPRVDPPLRVMMLGLRGCPAVQGGVERHVEALAPRLAELGCRVEVVARRPYVAHDKPKRWRGVVVTPLAAPRMRSLDAILHTCLGVVHAVRRRPDVLHIHAIGPSLLAPVARLLGLRVVVTHHGFDYDRAKWGRFARAVLRAGEWAGMRFAHRRIAVSQDIAASVRARFGVAVTSVPNGVAAPCVPAGTGAVTRYGLAPKRYVLTIGRLVPEKRQLDLVQAFARVAPPGWSLALVGGADHADAHSRSVLAAAERVPGTVATGFLTGTDLREITAHAGLFVLPSSHEGLPIALLEALSYGLPALASDIPANREVGLAEGRYFPVGDVDALAAALTWACAAPTNETDQAALRARIARDYDWDAIAGRTLALYEAGHAATREPRSTTLPRSQN